MLIGHLPAGYLASTVALGRIHADEAARRRLLLVALVCSVLPDLDTIYFYLVDSSQHHHAFVTHWPIFWAALTAIGVGVAAIRNDRLLRLAVLVGGMSAMLHLVLDSIAGQVYWLAPFSDVSVTLVEIPARYDSW
ncbi:MAG: metal-dependent hydrolase, partial [Bacteroidota bacterium]